MKIINLTEHIGGTLATLADSGGVEVDHIYAGDRMSDLLNAVTSTTLLVTNLSSMALVRIIELLDVPAICFLNGVMPGADMIDAARECGAALMVSPYNLYETCGRFYPLFSKQTGP